MLYPLLERTFFFISAIVSQHTDLFCELLTYLYFHDDWSKIIHLTPSCTVMIHKFTGNTSRHTGDTLLLAVCSGCSKLSALFFIQRIYSSLTTVGFLGVSGHVYFTRVLFQDVEVSDKHTVRHTPPVQFIGSQQAFLQQLWALTNMSSISCESTNSLCIFTCTL